MRLNDRRTQHTPQGTFRKDITAFWRGSWEIKLHANTITMSARRVLFSIASFRLHFVFTLILLPVVLLSPKFTTASVTCRSGITTRSGARPHFVSSQLLPVLLVRMQALGIRRPSQRRPPRGTSPVRLFHLHDVCEFCVS
ncbi:hypothetical protein CH063_12970 [Colletotrichum higginsianum]|uniref:Uncharacterized protein n=1 Tax=Colletotrichum higginsianum (strain IMI 349063) TaxID=759273 RepID=H1VSJ8_COLHI|nr:hypothetical protein CH063_12970 [Colletotrichum higginsianum]